MSTIDGIATGAELAVGEKSATCGEDAVRGGFAEEPHIASNSAMYALFMNLCGQYNIKKANKEILSFMPPDEDHLIGSAEAEQEREGGVEVHSVVREEEELAGKKRHDAAMAVKVPKFASLKRIPLSPQCILGTGGVCVYLELLRECPYLEEIDLSAVPNFYTHDSLKTAVDGNTVVRLLVDVASQHPSVTSINLLGHTIGTEGVTALTLMLSANGNITTVHLNTLTDRHVDAQVWSQFQRALSNNQAGRNVKAPLLRPEPSPRMQELSTCDRKTAKERQELHLLLFENKEVFGGVLTLEEMNELVLQATVLPLGECVRYCRGLRGDEANLFIIATGEIEATLGTQTCVLGRGDYFGEPCETALYTAGRVQVKSRGTCYRVPHRFVMGLAHEWERRVDDLLPLLKQTPLLQSVPLWVILRLCHDAKVIKFRPNEPAVPQGASYDGLFVVTQGLFRVPLSPHTLAAIKEAKGKLKKQEERAATHGVKADVTESDEDSITNRALREFVYSDLSGGGVVPGSSVAIVSFCENDTVLSFSRGDIFGEEPVVSRLPSSSVAIRAEEDTLNRREVAQCVQLAAATAKRHIITPLEPILQLQTKLYSTQDCYAKQYA